MISRIYKIDNEVVFYSPTLGERQTELYTNLCNGSSIAYDTEGNIIPTNEAIQSLSLICDRIIGNTRTDQVLANITLSDMLIAIVRSELLQYPNGEAMMGKLSGIVSMLQVGMFNTASQVLLTIPPDEIITTERLQKWSSMLIVSNAIRG